MWHTRYIPISEIIAQKSRNVLIKKSAIFKSQNGATIDKYMYIYDFLCQKNRQGVIFRGTPFYKKCPIFSWRFQKCNFWLTKNELNTIVNAMVKKALRGTNKRKRAVAKTTEELNQFETLSISGSEGGQHEETSETQLNSDSSSESSVSSDSS